MKTDKPPLELLNTADIAAKLGRSTYGVSYALGRLGIKPDAISGRFRFYHPSVVETLRENMKKKPNAR